MFDLCQLFDKTRILVLVRAIHPSLAEADVEFGVDKDVSGESK